MARTARQQQRIARLAQLFSARAAEMNESIVGASEAIVRGASDEAARLIRMATTSAEHMTSACRDLVAELLEGDEQPTAARTSTSTSKE